MTVQNVPTEKRYAANGVSLSYTIPFLLIEAGDLDVFLNGVEVSTGFSLTGVGNPTSTITFVSAPLGDLYLVLNVPFQRLVDYQENGDFLSPTVNRDYDRIWQALQQLFRGLGRSPVLGSTDVDGFGAYRAKGNRLSDLGDPTLPQDAATRHWAEAFISEILATGQGPINNAANVIIADVANWFVSLTVEGALAELGGRALLGTAGRGYNALSGVIAANGGPLAFINDGGHRPTGFSLTLSQPNTYSTKVNFLDIASRVSTFLAVPDETYAVAGILAGSSVFTDSAVIQASAPLTLKYAGFNAITAPPLWNSGALIGNTLMANGGVKITHPQATPGATPVVTAISATGVAGAQLAISDYTDNDVTIVAVDDMNGFISYNGTVWAQSLSNNVVPPSSIVFTAGNLVVTHPDVGTDAYNVLPIAFATSYQVVLANVSSTSFTIQFYTAAGVLVTVADTAMKFKYRRNAKVVRNLNGVTFSLNRGRCFVPNAAYQNLPAGNFWLYGVMEK